jgi:hypothetical protein
LLGGGAEARIVGIKRILIVERVLNAVGIVKLEEV